MWLLWYWYSPKLNILNNLSHFLSEILFQKGVVPLQRAQFWSTNKQFDNTTFQKFVEEKYRNWGIVHQYILLKVWMHPLIFEENKAAVEDQVRKFLASVSRGCYINWSVDLSFDNDNVGRLPNWKLWNWEHIINLLSSFIAHNRRNNKDKDLLTSRSCLIFQWFHQRNAVSGLAEIFPIDFSKIL